MASKRSDQTDAREHGDQPTPERSGKDSRDEPASGPHRKPREVGGPQGLEPTRYGDWERKGRCIDF